MSPEPASASWSDRILGGFRKTSERLAENLGGIVGSSRATAAATASR